MTKTMSLFPISDSRVKEEPKKRREEKEKVRFVERVKENGKMTCNDDKKNIEKEGERERERERKFENH